MAPTPSHLSVHLKSVEISPHPPHVPALEYSGVRPGLQQGSAFSSIRDPRTGTESWGVATLGSLQKVLIPGPRTGLATPVLLQRAINQII